MITFPWHSILEVERDRSYVALLGLVRLENIRIFPAFVRAGFVIERQLRRTPGVVGYRTAGVVHTLSFYHLSAWTDAEAIHRFVNTAPHETWMRELDGRLGETVFRYWNVDGASLPLKLSDELARVFHNPSA